MTLVQKEVKAVYLGDTKVRPSTPPARTFTISRTEKSSMASGWTYSDDAAGLTAGSGDFDDFFGYSAVLLNTSGVETAEMKQSGGVFTGAMTTLGNITSGDNVMIKFPVRGIKMSKSGSVVTLSITSELNKDGYQYYAHCVGSLSNPGTPRDAFYLGAYEGFSSSNVLKSWSGRAPANNQTITTFCTQAKANGNGHNIMGFYQRMYVNALYMMKYGNPNSQSTVGGGVTYKTSLTAPENTGNTNSQTSSTYGTANNYTTHCKLFGLEDRWGNCSDWIGGAYLDNSTVLYTQLTGWTGAASGGVSTGTTLNTPSGGNYNYILSSIAGNNKAMFAPTSVINTNAWSSYYAAQSRAYAGRFPMAGGGFVEGGNGQAGGALKLWIVYENTATGGTSTGCRLMYMNGLT